jgi:hypothetical protein
MMTDECRNMEDRWNDTDRGKWKHLEKDVSKYNFVHHISNIDWSGIEKRTSTIRGALLLKLQL